MNSLIRIKSKSMIQADSKNRLTDYLFSSEPRFRENEEAITQLLSIRKENLITEGRPKPWGEPETLFPTLGE